jgi:hypothetical protein
LIELLIRVLCDIDPEIEAEGAYLFGQTADNQLSVFETGVNLVRQRQARQVLIPDSAPRCGYPGFRAWHQALSVSGLGEADVVGIPIAPCSSMNTLTEAEALVRYAMANGMARVFVVATPFHQLRAFITIVSVVLREFPELRVYNRVGTALPWDQTVLHSQGVLQCTRSELIQSELARIERYRRKGDLVPEDQVLSYLRWRDR